MAWRMENSEWRQKVLSHNPGASSRQPYLKTLLDYLRPRYVEKFRESLKSHPGSDVDHFIVSTLALIALPQADPAKRTLHVGALADFLYERHQEFDDIEDLHASIEVGRIGISLPSQPNRHFYDFRVAHSAALRWRYHLLGHVEDLDEAIQLRSAVFEFIASHPSLTRERGVDSLDNLADVLCTRFEIRGDKKDLDTALSLYHTALRLSRYDQSKYCQSISGLAHVHRIRFKAWGEANDLEVAASRSSEALDLFKQDDPGRADALDALAEALFIRFQQCGDVCDLQRCILLRSEAVQYQPPQARFALNLATSLFIRFEHIHDLQDIQKAVELFTEALKLNPSKYYALEYIYPSFALCLARRFEALKEDEDLDMVVSLCSQAAQLNPQGLNSRVEALSSLGSALHVRSTRSGETDTVDLERAVDLQEKALTPSLCPPNNPNRAGCIDNLTASLLTRGAKKHCGDDFQRALRLQDEALNLRPHGHSQRSHSLFKVAHLWSAHYRVSHKQEHLSSAMASFANGVSYPYSSPRFRVWAGCIPWIAMAQVYQVQDELVKSHQAAVELLSQVASFSHVDPRFRLDALLQMSGVPCEAAAHTLRVSKSSANRAIELVEEGRSVFWTQSLQLRAPFDDLPLALSQKLKALARELDFENANMKVNTLSRFDHGNLSFEQEASRRRNRVDEFKSLLQAARRLSGFEGLLLPKKFEELAHVAQYGPVVVLLSSSVGCSAIIMRSPTTDAMHIPLWHVTDKRLRALSGDLQTASKVVRDALRPDINQGERKVRRTPLICKSYDDILADLWQTVVSPIFQALHLEKRSGRTRPRLWWVPTGAFAFLPVHAAGVSLGSTTDCTYEYVVSSYTPTLNALDKARSSITRCPLALPEDTKVLLLAQPSVPNVPSLPNTVEEVLLVANSIPEKAILRVRGEDNIDASTTNSNWTVQEIIAMLPQASILHLACHGQQDREDPLESGFLMNDGKLSVSQLLDLNIPRAFFAFLSACETATGDRFLPDETISLAAAMLFVGFKSVVATMWPMNDADGPKIAQGVYDVLFRDLTHPIHQDTVAYALDDAVRELRESGAHPCRWATYVHFGM